MKCRIAAINILIAKQKGHCYWPFEDNSIGGKETEKPLPNLFVLLIFVFGDRTAFDFSSLDSIIDFLMSISLA